MQHSADFTSFLAYQADLARAEQAIERRRAVEQHRLAQEDTGAASGAVSLRRHRLTRRAPRLAER